MKERYCFQNLINYNKKIDILQKKLDDIDAKNRLELECLSIIADSKVNKFFQKNGDDDIYYDFVTSKNLMYVCGYVDIFKKYIPVLVVCDTENLSLLVIPFNNRFKFKYNKMSFLLKKDYHIHYDGDICSLSSSDDLIHNGILRTTIVSKKFCNLFYGGIKLYVPQRMSPEFCKGSIYCSQHNEMNDFKNIIYEMLNEQTKNIAKEE